MRWIAGESELGYPNTFGNPMWMVIPDKLALYILEEYSEILRNKEKYTRFSRAYGRT
jgi:hypothetical protein